MNGNINKEKKPQKVPPRRPAGIWKYIIFFLLLWIVFSYLMNTSRSKKRTNLPYSTFKQQVEAGKINKVMFKGNEIQGEFVHQYQVIDTTKHDTTNYKYFASLKPDFQDPQLVSILEKKNVQITAENQGTSWLPWILILGVPWLLILGYSYYIRKRMGQGSGGMLGGGLFNIGKSGAKKFRQFPHQVTYEDVAGLENAKKDLKEIIEYLKDPLRFTTLGADVPKGVLLMGPPGTGKTLLARATAGEASVPFYSISGSEFIEMFVGVGASRVRDLFENAKREAPSIIFIDEIDSVGRVRGTGLGGGHDEREQTLNQILSEMDGFEPHESVVVMAATNRPDVLDPALIRPGRFDRQITLELPQKKAREKILRIHTRHIPIARDVDLENLSARTVGFSGAELKNLANEAALLAGRKGEKEVDAKDFDEARDKILLGAEREEIINEDEKKLVAYHESGHALVAKLLPDTDPLQKVTIIPRGRALGATEQVPAIDRHNYKKSYLLSRIAVALGGRAAEIIVFNEVSNGAESDLKSVNQLARRMVCNWGMSNKLGPAYFRQGEIHPFLGRELSEHKDFSDHTAELIDEEIQGIVDAMEKKAEKILTENREKLEVLAKALIEEETLENKEVDEILKKVDKKVEHGKRIKSDQEAK
jgi:cell division protease FtsH